MIQSQAQLRQALEQIQNLCAAVDSLRADILAKNFRSLTILPEGLPGTNPPVAGPGR
jgi:hypothetical protein